ncbi:MAG: EamA family transporter RarD [Pseudomonadales bacterium]|nr:EamA family transporter RarD [Pseudomonadales bacterium]
MSESGKGILYALAAYFMWGLAPLYFKLVDTVSPAEILVHRIIWSVIFLFGLVVFSRKLSVLIQFVKIPSNVYWLILSSLLIGGNWLTYIWALQNGKVLDTSLGYYINPLLSVVLGLAFLGESLRPLQIVAVVLASLGVLHEIVVVGRLPLVALILAFTFGLYGLVRKKVAVDAAVGLLVETLVLLPLAIIYFGYLVFVQENVFGSVSLSQDGFIVGLGLLTTLPLLCFGFAALRLPLTTLGFYQYLAPSMVLVLAVTLYGEAFTLERGVTFGLIISAILIFSIEALYAHPRAISRS